MRASKPFAFTWPPTIHCLSSPTTLNCTPSSLHACSPDAISVQGEQYVITDRRMAYQLPCGDLCPPPTATDVLYESTCLDQADREDVRAYEVRGTGYFDDDLSRQRENS